MTDYCQVTDCENGAVILDGRGFTFCSATVDDQWQTIIGASQQKRCHHTAMS